MQLSYAHMLYRDLVQAQSGLVLLSCLHLLYLVTPYDFTGQIKPNSAVYFFVVSNILCRCCHYFIRHTLMYIFKTDAFWEHCTCHIFVSLNDLLDLVEIYTNCGCINQLGSTTQCRWGGEADTYYQGPNMFHIFYF
jgi:hypothetical protein